MEEPRFHRVNRRCTGRGQWPTVAVAAGSGEQGARPQLVGEIGLDPPLPDPLLLELVVLVGISAGER